MKLEVDRFYRTRDGRRAHILAALCGNPNILYPVTGIIDGNDEFVTWTFSGHNLINSVSNYDLVSEWIEPIKIDGWINVYEDGITSFRFYQSKEQADQNDYNRSDRVACIRVTGTEEV